jgi:hypothetical protein
MTSASHTCVVRPHRAPSQAALTIAANRPPRGHRAAANPSVRSRFRCPETPRSDMDAREKRRDFKDGLCLPLADLLVQALTARAAQFIRALHSSRRRRSRIRIELRSSSVPEPLFHGTITPGRNRIGADRVRLPREHRIVEWFDRW